MQGANESVEALIERLNRFKLYRRFTVGQDPGPAATHSQVSISDKSFPTLEKGRAEGVLFPVRDKCNAVYCEHLQTFHTCNSQVIVGMHFILCDVIVYLCPETVWKESRKHSSEDPSQNVKC